MAIRVLVVSNFRLLLTGLSDLIERRSPNFWLAGAADSLGVALELAGKTNPDIVLLDIDSDPDAVLELIGALHAASRARIVLLTRLENHTLMDNAIVLGGRGVLKLDTMPETLFNALQKINAGQIWLDNEATGRVFVEMSRLGSKKPVDDSASKVAKLTDREQEIVACIASSSGEPGKTIAAKLHISESTLRNHLTAIYDKLGVANRHGLLAYAFQNGLTERSNP